MDEGQCLAIEGSKNSQCDKKHYLDNKIWLWSRGKNFNKQQIKEYAFRVYQDAGLESFKASDGWYQRWLNTWRVYQMNECPEKTDGDSLRLIDKDLLLNCPNGEGCNLFEDDCPSGSMEIEGTDEDCTKYKKSEKSDGNTHYASSTQPDIDFTENERLVTAEMCISAKNRKSHGKYLPLFKAKVVEFALEHSIKKAAEIFEVGRDTVSVWLREYKQNLPKPKEYLRTDCMFQHDLGPDDEFIQWLKSSDKSCMLSREDLLSKVLELVKQYNLKEPSKKNNWFFLYSKRLLKDEKTIINYPKAFKQEMVSYTTNFSKKLISKVFSIDRKRIIEWLDEFNNGKPSKRNVLSYVPDAKVDKAVWSWYLNQKDKPSSKEIRTKAANLYREAGFPDIKGSHGWYSRWRVRYNLPPASASKASRDSELFTWLLKQIEQNRLVSHSQLVSQATSFMGPDFKASQKWVFKFLKRYTPLIQPGLSSVSLPDVLEEDLNNFIRSISSAVSENKLTSGSIVAFDEFPLNFACPEFFKKEFAIGKSSWDNCQGSVILTCRADGKMIPTCLILKAPVDDSNNSTVVKPVLVQPEGINDRSTIEKWLGNFLEFISGPTIIICDAYDPHFYLRQLISEQVKDRQINLFVTPPGCSFYLQPLLFGISEKFKEYIHSSYQQRTHEKHMPGTISHSLPSDAEIFQWVQKAHFNLELYENELIKNAFHKVGFMD